jgi:hypothetical protein
MTPEQLAARLKSHSFASRIEPLMNRITLTLLRHAQQRTPVRTGTLRRSETTFVEPGGLRGTIGTNIKYAIYVHKNQPFFQQAIDDGRGDVAKLLQAAGDAYFASIT